MEWAAIVERLGFPIFVALVLLWAFGKTAKWFGIHILIPIRDAHTSFLQSLQNSQHSISDTQHKQAVTLEKLTELQEQYNEETQYIRGILERATLRGGSSRRNTPPEPPPDRSSDAQ